VEDNARLPGLARSDWKILRSINIETISTVMKLKF